MTFNERQKALSWADEHCGSATLPFSFNYGGIPASECVPRWEKTVTAQVTEWIDPVSRLKCRLEMTICDDFPVVEWVVTLRNDGPMPTPLVTDLLGMNVTLGLGEPVLHHHKGDTCGADAFEPQTLFLEKETNYAFAPVGGRPTSIGWPYFNVEQDNQGVIVVLGWPGQWKAEFERDSDGLLHVRGGQERTHFRLQPGETARTPRSVLLFWEGDRLRGQNLWRRWMLAHNLPRVEGALPPPMTSQCMGLSQSEASERAFMSALVQNEAKVDYWWMDAGWWKEGFPIVGNWEPDPIRFPQGIRPVAEYAHASRMKFVLWFEPERVSPETPWAALDNWLLSLPSSAYRERNEIRYTCPKFTYDEAERNQCILGDRLLNLGNAEARTFLTEFLAARIEDWGINFLRIDFNISPLAFWREADAPDRQGLTENCYVMGWLTLLDDLCERFPRLWIDTCASGGRRIDLETLRRTLPLLRSDYQFEPVGNQGHTYGLASWVPYHGTGVYYNDTYEFRSSLAPATGLGYHADSGEPDWDIFRQRLAEHCGVSPYFLGDFYPLLHYTRSSDSWMAWQFHRPDLNEGMVQIFRRADSPFERASLKLHALDPAAIYEVHFAGESHTAQYTGAGLIQDGLPVMFQTAPQALCLIYRCLSPAP